jgi:glycosyltransferase 2 family protein
MKGFLGKLLQVIVFFAIGIFIMYLVYNKQDTAYQAECTIKGIAAADCSLIDKVLADISGAHINWIIVSMLIFVLSNVIRALRWKMMFNAIGYEPAFFRLLMSIFINYLANLGIPRSGEVIRASVVARYENIPLDKTLGTVVLDRVLDTIMFGLFFVASLIFGGKLFLEYLERNFNQKFDVSSISYWLVGGLIAVVVFGLLLVRKYWSTIRANTLVQKIERLITGFVEGIKSIKDVNNKPLFIFYTVAIWACFFVMLRVMFFAFDPTSQLGLVAALIVFVFGSLGMLIPTPGGMGPYHFLISEGLQLNGLNGTDGFTFANILFFSIQVGITIIALVVLPLTKRSDD